MQKHPDLSVGQAVELVLQKAYPNDSGYATAFLKRKSR